MSLVRLIARPLLASSFVLTGLDRVRKPEESGERLRPNLRRAASVFPQLEPVASKPALVARCIGAAQVVSGLMLALGKFPRFSALVLVGSSALTGFNDNAGDSRVLTSNRIKNISLAGGVLLASVDTAGAPSLAWRARHLGHDARKQLAKTNKELSKTVREGAKDARKTTEGVIGH